MATYDEIVQAVLREYDSGSEFWGRVNNGTASAAEIYRAYSMLPNFTVQRSRDGYILGTDWSHGLNQLTYADPSESQRLTDELNRLFSNSAHADYGGGNSYNVNIPGSWGGNGSNGYTNQAGALVSGGGSRLATIADKASLAVTGVNIGAKLGAAIDNALYNLDPEWWDTHYPAINPQTWTSLVSESEFGTSVFRTLFGIRDTGVTGYVDERVLAQTYQLLRDSGFWGDGGREIIIDETAIAGRLTYNWTNVNLNILPFGYWRFRVPSACSFQEIIFPSDVVATMIYANGIPTIVLASRTSQSYIRRVTNMTTGEVTETTFSLTQYADVGGYGSSFSLSSSPHFFNNIDEVYNWTDRGFYILGSPSSLTQVSGSGTINITDAVKDWITIVLNSEIRDLPTTPGITKIPNATQYPPTNITGTTLNDVLTQLKQQYPDLFNDSITESVLQEDGTITDRNYVPIPWGITDLGHNPTTSDNITEDVKPDDFIDLVTRDPTTNPPDTGTGTQSPFVMPTGSGSSLWAVYHPSQAQLNAFGAWLWSSDFVEQLKKLFNDPMQAIIGVHKVFAPIPTGGSQTIKCGYLDSGVSSPTVSSQYTEVNCGTVDCWEYFGNVFDYDPHTKVSIYLPFIGVVPLKVSEVMRASINVTYGVDVITGACLAKVKIMRDGGGAILYSYGGSCACHYPISSGSYAGIISGIVTSAIGIAGGIAAGNPLSAIGGAVGGLHQAHTEVQRSGGFTGCAGAMGPKKPYLIIDRPQTNLAANFEIYQGEPANTTQFIGDCTGFVRAAEVHFSAPGAFDDEAKEVEALLKSGVLISD